VEFQVRWKAKFPFPTFQETWTRLGRDTIVVDGQRMGAIVLQRDLQGLTPYWGNVDHRQWKIWYSPVRGVIKQVELAPNEAQTAAKRGDISVIAVEPY
jgi:hypothetical protein